MAPRKAASATIKSGPVPPPNETHPARSQIPSALTQGHPHSSSYHSFVTSRYFPSPSASTASNGKKRARVAPALAELVDSPLEAHVLHEKLLEWYDGVKESRSMPWRKEKEVDKMSKSERTQRAYEVNCAANLTVEHIADHSIASSIGMGLRDYAAADAGVDGHRVLDSVDGALSDRFGPRCSGSRGGQRSMEGIGVLLEGVEATFGSQEDRQRV